MIRGARLELPQALEHHEAFLSISIRPSGCLSQMPNGSLAAIQYLEQSTGPKSAIVHSSCNKIDKSDW